MSRMQDVPLISLDVLITVNRGDHHAMLRMIDEFVRAMLMQLSAIRQAMTLEEDRQMYTACEVVRSVARRFGAVWLARAASHLMWLLTLARATLKGKGKASRKEKKHFEKEKRLALDRAETEIVFISRLAEQLHALLSPHALAPPELLTAIVERAPFNSETNARVLPLLNPTGTTGGPPQVPPELARSVDSAITMMRAIDEGDSPVDSSKAESKGKGKAAAVAEVRDAVFKLHNTPDMPPHVPEASNPS